MTAQERNIKEGEYLDLPVAKPVVTIQCVEDDLGSFYDYHSDSFIGLDERSPILDMEILDDKRPLLNLQMYGHETGLSRRRIEGCFTFSELNDIKNNCIYGLYQALTSYMNHSVNNNKKRNIQVDSILQEIHSLDRKFKLLNPERAENFDKLLVDIMQFQSFVSGKIDEIVMEYRHSLKKYFFSYTRSEVFNILNEYTRNNAELFCNNNEGFMRWLTRQEVLTRTNRYNNNI